MTQLESYLFFDGRCAEAMRFYEKTLGGQMEGMFTYGESPDPQHCPADARDLVMHARLRIGDRALMASDTPPGMGFKPMAGCALSLTYDTPDEARRVFDALSQGGSVTMAMQKTFWSQAFGMFADRFGTQWMVGGGMLAP
jgi:PhnB protein